MNIKWSPKYWFADKETKFNLLLDEKYPSDCFDKEKEKLDREFPTNSEKELDSYKLRLNELEFKYKLKDEYEFEKFKIPFQHLRRNLEELAYLELSHKFKRISDIDYMKEKADIEGKPFVAVKPNFDEYDGDNFYLEMVYNDIFIDKLKKQGYTGFTDEDIVEQWFKFKMINTYDNLVDLAQNQIPTEISKIDMPDGKKLYK